MGVLNSLMYSNVYNVVIERLLKEIEIQPGLNLGPLFYTAKSLQPNHHTLYIDCILVV